MAPAAGGSQRARREAKAARQRIATAADAEPVAKTAVSEVAAPAKGGDGGAGGNWKRYMALREVSRQYYSSLGKAEWWWLMDDVEEMIAEELKSESFAVIDEFLLPEQAKALKSEVERSHRDGKLQQAGLVNGRVVKPDAAAYYEQDWPYGGQLGAYLTKLGTLIAELGDKERNLVPALSRITSRSKAMIACYPGGGSRYIKHVDNDGKHEFCRTRVLTALMYLNDEWQPGDGGELAVFSPDGDRGVGVERAVVEPFGNRLLLFWSDWRVPHEVRPAQKPRYAVTLWLLDNTCNGKLAGTEVKRKLTSLRELQEGASEVASTQTARGEAVEGEDEMPQSKEVRFEWKSLEGEGEAEVLPGNTAKCVWELRVEVLGQAPECPAVDVSDSEVRLSCAATGRRLFCEALPSAGAVPIEAPRWSRKKATLVLRFADTVAAVA